MNIPLQPSFGKAFRKSGGGGAGGFGALLEQSNDSRRGLFIYGPDSDPSWHLRGVLRTAGDPAVAPRARFYNVDGDAYLEWTLPLDLANPRQERALTPEELNRQRIFLSPTVEEPGPAVAASLTLLDGTDEAVDVTFPAGAASNGTIVQIGSPIAAVAAVGASVILRATRGGTERNGIRINFPASDGAASNGIVVTVGDFGGTYTWDSDARTLQVHSDGTVTIASIIIGINAISGFPGTASRVGGARNSDVVLLQSRTVAGGVSAVEALPSGSDRWDANVRLLYLASTGMPRASNVVSRINAVTDFPGTAALASGASGTDRVDAQSRDAAGGRDAVVRNIPGQINLLTSSGGGGAILITGAQAWGQNLQNITLDELRTGLLAGTYPTTGPTRSIRPEDLVLNTDDGGSGGDPADANNVTNEGGGTSAVPPGPIEFLVRGEDEGKYIEVRYRPDEDSLQDILDAIETNNDGGAIAIPVYGTDLDGDPEDAGFDYKPFYGTDDEVGGFGSVLRPNNGGLTGLWIGGRDVTPEWELRLVERAIEEDAVRAGATYQAGDGNSLRVVVGDTTRDDRRWITADSPLGGVPEVVNTWRLIHDEVGEWRSRAIAGDGVLFRAKAAGSAPDGITVEARGGTPGEPAIAGAPAILQVQGRRAGASADAIDVSFPIGTAGNGWTVDPRAAVNVAAAAATGTLLIRDGQGGNILRNVVTAVWYETGPEGNGFQIVFSRSNGDFNSRVTYASATRLNVMVGSQSTTTFSLRDAINAARYDDNGTERQLVSVTYTGNNQQITNANLIEGTLTLSGGVDAGSEANGFATVDAANKVLEIALTGNVIASTFTGFINAATGFPGTAQTRAGQANRNIRPGDGPSEASSGGIDAVPAVPRSALTVTEASNGRVVTITGLLGTDTIAQLRAAASALTLIDVVTPSDRLDTDTVVFPLAGDPGDRQFLVTLANGSARPTPSFTSNESGGIYEITIEYVGATYAEGLRTTLAEFKAAWESFESRADHIAFTETGTQSERVTAVPTGFDGGSNYIPPSPIELLYRGEDDGRNIEIRYHTDEDDFQDIIDIWEALSHEDITIYTLPGTNLFIAPEEPPATRPMLVQSTGGGGTTPTPSEGGLSQSQVDARIRALVLDAARTGNTEAFGDDKIPDDIARDSELPDVIDDLDLSLSGSTLTLTAGQTGSAADIVGTVDLSDLEEWVGRWEDLTLGDQVNQGEICTHDGVFFIARVDHQRGQNGPAADATNWALLNNWGGTYDGTRHYHAGTFVDYANAVWVSPVAVTPADPNPDASANVKWRRLGGNVEAFTGVTRDGGSLRFTRDSGQNPVTIAEHQVEAGELVHRVVGAANYDFTTLNQYTTENTNETPISRGDIADGDLLGITIGGVTNAPNTVVIFPASVIADSAAVGDTAAAANQVHIESTTFTDIAIGLAWDSDGHLLAAGGPTQDPTPLTLYRFAKAAEEEDAPPLPVSRAESIGITADLTVGQRAWANISGLDAAPEVKFGEGGPIILTRDSTTELTVKRGVYTVWFIGGTNSNAERASPVFRIRSTDTTPVELARTDVRYLRSAQSSSSQPFRLAANLILENDTQITMQAGSDPDSNASPAPATGATYGLESDGFEIIFVPTGGSETIFYPQSIGLATFDLTGAAQNVALVDANGNAIIAPDTGYLLATYDVPPLGLRGSTQLVRADRLREARAASDLTSGLYTDPDTHQIYYEVAAHAGGATSGNTILVEHIKTAVPVTPSEPTIDPAITEFRSTSGNLSPAPGSIASSVYGYELAISQPGHVSAADIIGFAGAGTSGNPSTFATLATVTDYHDETGTVTIPAATELAAAGDIYTMRLRVFKTGQTPATDEPIAYHDIRITAHAPATAAYHWGRVQYQSGETAQQTLDRITDFTGDITTGDRLASGYAATPGNTGFWQFYFLAAADETQPVGWDSGGLHADAAFFPVLDKTIATVAYKAWIMRPTYRRELADGSINYQPRTS